MCLRAFAANARLPHRGLTCVCCCCLPAWVLPGVCSTPPGQCVRQHHQAKVRELPTECFSCLRPCGHALLCATAVVAACVPVVATAVSCVVPHRLGCNWPLPHGSVCHAHGALTAQRHRGQRASSDGVVVSRVLALAAAPAGCGETWASLCLRRHLLSRLCPAVTSL